MIRVCAYLNFLLSGGFTLDLTITPSVWYLVPYVYRNPNVGSGLRWLCYTAHCNFVYYEDWLEGYLAE